MRKLIAILVLGTLLVGLPRLQLGRMRQPTRRWRSGPSRSSISYGLTPTGHTDTVGPTATPYPLTDTRTLRSLTGRTRTMRRPPSRPHSPRSRACSEKSSFLTAGMC